MCAQGRIKAPPTEVFGGGSQVMQPYSTVHTLSICGTARWRAAPGAPFLHLMISSGPSSIFMQRLRTEVIISAIISAILWGLSVASRHEDEMTGTGDLEAMPRCSEMSFD
jgi:hypothetical protein